MRSWERRRWKEGSPEGDAMVSDWGQGLVTSAAWEISLTEGSSLLGHKNKPGLQGGKEKDFLFISPTSTKRILCYLFFAFGLYSSSLNSLRKKGHKFHIKCNNRAYPRKPSFVCFSSQHLSTTLKQNTWLDLRSQSWDLAFCVYTQG